jgi:CcmD family protein
VSNTAWLVVAFAIVALAVGGYVLSVVGRTKKLEDHLRTLRDRAH